MSSSFKKQTFWNKSVENATNTIMWVGDYNSISKIYSIDYIINQNYKSILDIGCANRSMKFGFQAHGYDIKYQGVDSCEYFIADDVIESDVRESPLSDNCFDVVFSRHVVEHQPDFETLFNETIRLGIEEVIHIFFKRPHNDGEENRIHYDETLDLYHNYFSRILIERFLNGNKKVLRFFWKPISDTEEALHIILSKDY